MLSGLKFFCMIIVTTHPSTAAFEYLKSNPVGTVDSEDFSQYCGVGVIVTPQQIEEQVLLYMYMPLDSTSCRQWDPLISKRLASYVVLNS